MISRDDMSEGKQPVASAGLAGAGGGTLLTIIANSLPEGSVWKPWVLYLAPSFAVLLSAIWLWTQRQIASHFREREVSDLFQRAKNTLEAALRNPNTTPEHRTRLQKQLEELEMLDVGRVVDRIKSLRMLDTMGSHAPDQKEGVEALGTGAGSAGRS